MDYKGFEKRMKNKRLFIRDFIKCRTKTSKKQYKVYKNKLTVILRQAKRDYYNKRLLENKNDIKSTWKILNEVIANNPVPISKPSFYINDSKVVLKKKHERSGK